MTRPSDLMGSCIAKALLAYRKDLGDREPFTYNRKCQVKCDI